MILYRLCLVGVFISLSAAIYLIFSPHPDFNSWLLPVVSLAGWFCCGAAWMALRPWLNANMAEDLSWWQRQKYRLRWLTSRLLLIFIVLLSLNLILISFRALRLF